MELALQLLGCGARACAGAMVQAAAAGMTPVVQRLLQMGISADACAPQHAVTAIGVTMCENALCAAARQLHVGVVEALLEAGAQPDSPLDAPVAHPGDDGLDRGGLDATLPQPLHSFVDPRDAQLKRSALLACSSSMCSTLHGGGMRVVGRGRCADADAVQRAARISAELIKAGANLHALEPSHARLLLDVAACARAPALARLLATGANP